MTPQLHIKLLAQIARQSPELSALDEQIASAQPAIDSAQSWRDSTSTLLESAQAALSEVQAVEGADVSGHQDAVDSLTDSLARADADLAALTAPRNAAADRAEAIRASIAHCQSLIDAGGLTQADIDAYLSGESTAQSITDEKNRVAALWQAAHDYEFQQVSGSAIGLLAMGVMMGKPKCLAVQNWIKGIWTVYYTRKATGSHDTDYSGAGQIPYSVPDLMAELGV